MATKQVTGNDLLDALELVSEELVENPDQQALLVFSEIVEGIEATYAVA